MRRWWDLSDDDRSVGRYPGLVNDRKVLLGREWMGRVAGMWMRRMRLAKVSIAWCQLGTSGATWVCN